MEILDTIIEIGVGVNNKKKINEDLYLIKDNLVMVLDGATGLGENYMDKDSDAAWFVNQVVNKMKVKWSKNKFFMDTLSETILEIEDLYFKKVKNFKKYEIPSSAFVAFVDKGEYFEMYYSGDCSAYVLNEKGNILKLNKESNIVKFDNEAKNVLSKLLIEGKNFKEARKEMLPVSKNIREKMNTPNGYGCLSVEKRCLDYIEKEIIKKEDLKSLILMTDGFSPLIEDYKKEQYAEYFNEEKNLKKGLNFLREKEKENFENKKNIKLKLHDDATAIKIKIQ